MCATIVLATKYTTGFRSHTKKDIQANMAGNHAKSLRVSVEASLQKLHTGQIDIVYTRGWDDAASIEEAMPALNQVVLTGMVIDLSISDTPAWAVSRTSQHARGDDLQQFCLYPGWWAASYRDFEREVLPMCAAEGTGIAPWAVYLTNPNGYFEGDCDGKMQEGFQTHWDRQATIWER